MNYFGHEKSGTMVVPYQYCVYHMSNIVYHMTNTQHHMTWIISLHSHLQITTDHITAEEVVHLHHLVDEGLLMWSTELLLCVLQT